MKRSKPPFERGRGGSSSSGNSSSRSNNSQRSYTPTKVSKSASINIETFHDILKKDVAWITKARTDRVLFLNKEDLSSNLDIEQLRQKYLDTTFYPTLALKPRNWLKTIVSQKGLEITHFWSTTEQSGPPNFSKCIIREILNPQNWAMTPNQELPLVKSASNEIFSFNYWDYQDAMFKVFLYQNPKQKHTWMFILRPEALKGEIPPWFCDWWTIYGAEIKMLPTAIQELYSKWEKTHPILSKLISSEVHPAIYPIYFFAETEIPWIWNWTLAISKENHLPILKRKYHTRWWSGIIIEDKVKGLQQVIQQNLLKTEKELENEVQKNDHLLNIAKLMRQKYPGKTDAEIQQKCFQYMQQQFASIFGGTISSSSSDNQDEAIMQDAQNPEEENEERDISLWAQGLQILADQQDKGKGKLN